MTPYISASGTRKCKEKKRGKNKWNSEKTYTIFIFCNNFLLCEGLIGCYSSWLDYWQKFNAVRYYLTEIQIPKSTGMFDYPGPFTHINKLVSKWEQSYRALCNEIHLQAMNCKFSSSQNKKWKRCTAAAIWMRMGMVWKFSKRPEPCIKYLHRILRWVRRTRNYSLAFLGVTKEDSLVL